MEDYQNDKAGVIFVEFWRMNSSAKTPPMKSIEAPAGNFLREMIDL
jgi:hypothetical protein